jgi:hypothetical protein
MAMRTFTHLYDTYEEATQAVRALRDAGVPAADISLVANDAENRFTTTSVTDTTSGDRTETDHAESTGAGTGATVGTLLGGGAGLLAGIGALAIPGIGPVVAAGWLIATLAGAGVGAVSGGLLGSLVGAGVPEEDAHTYVEGVRRGGTLVTVRADESMAAAVHSALSGHTPVDIAARRAEYQAEGWTRYDPAAPALTADQVREHWSRRTATRTAGSYLGSDAPDGTSGNPPGTATTRAVDRTLGTDVSGAYPEHENPDGTPGNPPGTAASRSVDRTLGTNISGANPERRT